MKLVVERIIFLFILFSFNLNAQSDKVLSVKHMHKDFDEILLALEAHPDPFTHIPEEEFMAKFEEVKSSIAEPLRTLDFYKKVATMIALVKDGHTSTYLPRFWMQKKRKELGVFPYEVFLTNDDELYISKNFSQDEIPAPAKILSLNGVSVDSFINEIDPYISYELKPFRNTIIDDRFEMYLYLAFGASDSLEMEYVSSDTTTVVVQNMPLQEWKKFQKDDREEKEKRIARGQPYDYSKISKGIGMISIYSFSVSGDNLNNYKNFLQKTFKSIKADSIQSLIIDIRGNYGGWPKISSELFHYLTELPFKVMAKSNTKVSEAYKEYFYRQYPFLRYQEVVIQKNLHYRNIDAVLRNEIGTYANEDDYYNEGPITKKYEFTGDCYLLTNRDSYSAASSFASTFQCYQMGTIIGEETGGTKIFRANTIPARLSRSSIGIGVSTTRNYTPCFWEEMKGVTPTVEYTPSIFEIGSELDTQLLFAQRLIKKVQKKKAEMTGGE